MRWSPVLGRASADGREPFTARHLPGQVLGPLAGIGESASREIQGGNDLIELLLAGRLDDRQTHHIVGLQRTLDAHDVTRPGDGEANQQHGRDHHRHQQHAQARHQLLIGAAGKGCNARHRPRGQRRDRAVQRAGGQEKDLRGRLIPAAHLPVLGLGGFVDRLNP